MKITIITITLNSESTIRDTLNSVYSQSYQNIEHIIVDGGSKDSTLAIIRRYPNKNKKIIIKKGSNIYEAMNIGIKNSSGDFIAILNSDDIYQSESIIEEVVNIIKKNKNINIFLGNLIYFKDNNYYKIVRFYSAKKFKPWMFRYGLMPPHPSSFIKRSIYKKYGLYEERFKIASDFDLFLRLIFIKRIAYKTINKIIVRMRTGGVSGKNINSYITINNEINQSFKKNNINVKIFQFLLRGLSKLSQFIILNQDIHNKNFKLSGLKFDKDELFKNNFNLITNINKIPFNKNFILSGMNLAFLGYFASGKVFPFKNLYHWPDGIFIKKFIKIEKIPGRKIINDLKLPSEIKRIIVLGSISKKSMLYLLRKYKLKITNIPLPYAPINEIIKQKIKLSSNALTLITLPTPKQEQLAYELTKYNKKYKIICIGASIAIASGEEKTVPKIISNYEFIWRLRTETYRRIKRLLETYIHFKNKIIFTKLFKKVSFRIYK